MVSPFPAFTPLQCNVAKCDNTVIIKGLAPSSPIAFACFGQFLAKIDCVRTGRKFTVLARTLLDELQTKEGGGIVYCVVGEVQAFVEPIQANDSWRCGESVSLSIGDIHMACLNR